VKNANYVSIQEKTKWIETEVVALLVEVQGLIAFPDGVWWLFLQTHPPVFSIR
jgi:hypothetical protein